MAEEEKIECKYCMYIKPKSEMKTVTIKAGNQSKDLPFCKDGKCAESYQEEITGRYNASLAVQE